MAYHFKNLIFEGGVVRGIAYLGALQVLEDKGILKPIQRVGGTSAGAINAVLLGLDYSIPEMKEILFNLNFKDFLDDSFGIIRDTYRTISKFGFYKGDKFYNWISELIKEKTGNPKSTFKDLQKNRKQNSFKDMYFIGANLSTGFAEVYSHEDVHINMPIADAVRISMSIPLFFAAKRNLKRDVIVDGGLLNNYPIKLFDRKIYILEHGRDTGYYEKDNEDLEGDEKEENPYVYNMETLGFRLDEEEEINVFKHIEEPKHEDITGLVSYIKRLVATNFNIQSSMHLHSDDWHRTIYIDTLKVSSFDFDIDTPKKEKLVNKAVECTEEYFDWYDKKDCGAKNKPDPVK